MNLLRSQSQTIRRGVNLSQVVWFALLITVHPYLKALSAEPATGRPQFASTPTTLAEWKGLEARAEKAIQDARPSVVAVRVSSHAANWSVEYPHFEHFASGVIIRGDGLILSQWHVTHKLGTDSREPGAPAEVVLHDGRRLKAELLSADPLRDMSLLRIIEPGDYPHAELAPNNSVALGDWVLKLGHPNGYRANRGTVSRMGRVLFLGQTIDIVADCQAAGGDSGGPLFNLGGQVIGVIGSSPQGVHFFPATPHPVSPWCYTNVETIRELMPALLKSHPDAMPLPSSYVPDERTFLARNPHLTEDLILSDADVGDARLLLPLDEWRQGRKTRAAWRELTESHAQSVVEVLCDKHHVALGTVVGANGWILTKASEIFAEPRCRLANGQVLPARVAGTDVASDLALLKIEATELHAIEWSQHANRPAGTVIAALNGRGEPMATGIISVPQRALEGPFPTVLNQVPRRGPPIPAPLELLGQPHAGRGFVVAFVQGRAADAGIRLHDVLRSIDDRSIRQQSDLKSSIRGHEPGDTLRIVVERDGQPINLTMPLQAEHYRKAEGADRTDESFRHDDFPIVFEHDIPLWLNECGGPLIDLEGKTIGITIARVGQHGGMALPANVIKPLIQRLKSADDASRNSQ